MLDRLRPIDHHCHGVVGRDLERPEFEDLMTESPWPSPAGTTGFDSPIGLAIRRRCAPLLDLDPGCSPEDYLARRSELGASEVNHRLLGGARPGGLVIETGFRGEDLLSVGEMAGTAGCRAWEVVRLEAVAESVLLNIESPSGFPDAYRAALAEAAVGAVGLKTIVAYRFGLDFDPQRPTDAGVTRAVQRWLRDLGHARAPRVADPVLLRFLIWCAVDTGLPLQFHVGYGDADVELHRCNPLLLTSWLRATRETGVRVMLLHCYPYHREAGYLAQVFPHVYCDVGLAVNYTGARSDAVIAESLELTPFHKALFSTDAFGLAELYLVGSFLFRRGIAGLLQGWIDRGDACAADAERIVDLICRDNAHRVYSLGHDA